MWYPPKGYKPNSDANKTFEERRKLHMEEEYAVSLEIAERRERRLNKWQPYVGPYTKLVKWTGPFVDKKERGIWRTNFMRVEDFYLRLDVSKQKFNTEIVEFKLAHEEDQKLWVTGRVVKDEVRCVYPEKYIVIVETFSIGKLREKRNLVLMYERQINDRDRDDILTLIYYIGIILLSTGFLFLVK